MTLELTGLFGYNIRDKNVREEINNINDKIKGYDSQLTAIANELGRDAEGNAIVLETEATDIRSAINEINSKSQTTVTDEQIDSAVTKYLNENPVMGGLTSTAKNLLITILRNATYLNSDQSNNITLLENALAESAEGGGDTPVVTSYKITNNLTNCANSNANTSVYENSSYIATISANEGYVLDSVVITMGGTDITSSAYNEGQISITSVTGDIVITASSIEVSSIPTMPTDGLVDYFDFRNCEYNNAGSGGSTIIKATQGNGSLFTWANNVVTGQDDYGISYNRSLIYDANGGTSQSNCGTAFTWVFKCYIGSSVSSPFFSTSYAIASNISKMQYKPGYNNASGTAQVTSKDLGNRVKDSYDTVCLTVDGSICKLYFGSTLVDTQDGSTIDGFVSWVDKLSCNILGGVTNGKLTQLAIYNKALSEVEIVELDEYLKSLEVA